MIQLVGSDYGGHYLDVDRIQDGDVVLDAGVGSDLSFALSVLNIAALNIAAIKLVFVDPDIHTIGEKASRLGVVINGALSDRDGVGVFYRSVGNQSSGSLLANHRNAAIGTPVELVSAARLMREHGFAIVKLDIEGSEYDVLPLFIGARQISVEFHHVIVRGYSLADTAEAISVMRRANYEVHRMTEWDYLFIQG